MTRPITQHVADLRAETSRADTKASILVAAMGLSLGTPLTRTPPDCATTLPCQSLWWLAVLTWLSSLACLLLALLPRYHRTSWTRDVSLTATANELRRIIVLKYRWTRAAIVLFMLATTAVSTLSLMA